MLFILSIIGWSITSILVNGSIFDPLRNYLIVKTPFFAKLMTCVQCSGFWVGAFIGILTSSGILENPFSSIIYIFSEYFYQINLLMWAFWNSGISVLLNSLLIFLLNPNRNEINREQDF
jgi:hypothetical protein